MQNADFFERMRFIGLTQIEFATIAGITAETLTRWKKSEKSVPKWAEALLIYIEKDKKASKILNEVFGEKFQRIIKDNAEKDKNGSKLLNELMDEWLQKMIETSKQGH